jgi:hypothetical protein
MTYHVKIHFQRNGKFRPPTVLTGMASGGTLDEALRYKIEESRVRFPISRTMALVSSQREMSTWVFSWGRGKGGRCVCMTTLPPPRADCLEILEASASWSPKDLSKPEYELLYLLYVTNQYSKSE